MWYLMRFAFCQVWTVSTHTDSLTLSSLMPCLQSSSTNRPPTTHPSIFFCCYAAPGPTLLFPETCPITDTAHCSSLGHSQYVRVGDTVPAPHRCVTALCRQCGRRQDAPSRRSLFFPLSPPLSITLTSWDAGLCEETFVKMSRIVKNFLGKANNEESQQLPKSKYLFISARNYVAWNAEYGSGLKC